jgi:hypothetical protein
MSRTAFVPAILLLLPFVSAAQNIDAALQTLATKHPAEKIYIHYDKDYYVAGETVWFKAYLYSNGQPGDLSYNFYLQLADSKGKIIVTQKYPIKGATVSGSIELPDSLEQGSFIIRAMTPEMLNADHDFIYSKSIFIFKPGNEKKTDLAPATAEPLSIRFFPEGGNLVEDILSVVAFKAADNNGRPVDISGIIKVDDTVTAASFRSLHDGIGKFQFRPKAGKKYTAAITFNGQTNFYPLPEAQPSGINLRVENEKGGKVFSISRSRKDKEVYAQVRIVAQMNNRVVYDNEVMFDNFFIVKGHLVTDSMPSGILHFTVFNKDGLPLAERISFVDNREYVSAGEISVVKEGTGKREENSMAVNFPEAVQRSLSVSVTDISVSGAGNTDDIISALLLTSDLRGVIHNPSWYFRQQADSAAQAMDNLMLTHGWSRFSWKKILSGEFPEKKITDQYLIAIAGIVKDNKSKALVSGGKLSIFIEAEDSVNQNFDIPVDGAGKFIIDSLLARGRLNLYYAYTTAKGDEKPVDMFLYPVVADSAVRSLQVNDSYTDEKVKYTAALFGKTGITPREIPQKSKLNQTKDLAPVILKPNEYKRPIDEVNEKYTSGVFTSMGRSNFDNINEPENDRALSVYDFARRSVKQIIEQDGEFVNRRNFGLFNAVTPMQDYNKQKSKDSLRAAVGGRPGDENENYKIDYTKGKHFVVAVYLNESPAYVGILKTIPMEQVALIKFYEPGFIGSGAAESPGGVLSVYTKKTVIPEGRLDKLDNISYKGYTLTKEFYSPDYATAGSNILQEDYRSTLYWNPELYTSSQSGTVQLKFFNNDFSKKLKIVIEGFDTKGKLIHIEKIIGE